MSSPPAELRLRDSAYVFFEEPGAASWSARLAAAELPVALLWGGSLLGFVAMLLLWPHASKASAAVMFAVEGAMLLSAIALSAAWLRGHRTPVLTADALILEGAMDRRVIGLAEIARVEIAALAATEPPVSRVTIHLQGGARARLDLPRRDALTLCREVQRRLFGGGQGAPYDPALRTLDRARAPITTWIAQLRERFGRSGYRYAAGIAEDELDRALHDSALPAARRVGAALAMCAAGGAEGRERTRRAAVRLETEALRIAVERAADGELDEETLAAAEAEDAALGREAA